MCIRKPAVAGSFYPAEVKSCTAEAADCVTASPLPRQLPEKIVAGIVPHAGWTFSGDMAGMVFAAIARVEKKVDTFIIFGAAHSYYGSVAAVCDSGLWQSPLGDVEIDVELARAIIQNSTHAESNIEAHKYEHSIEVQLPLIKYLFKDAKVVPVLTPPADFALQLGAAVAESIKRFAPKNIICIGSTDLTHYGRRYGFDPQGSGPEAIRWAKEVNDAGFLKTVLNMDSSLVISTATQNASACGPGAAAATIEAAKSLGKTDGLLLGHTHSSEVMQNRFGQSSDESVGYAAVIF